MWWRFFRDLKDIAQQEQDRLLHLLSLLHDKHCNIGGYEFLRELPGDFDTYSGPAALGSDRRCGLKIWSPLWKRKVCWKLFAIKGFWSWKVQGFYRTCVLSRATTSMMVSQSFVAPKRRTKAFSYTDIHKAHGPLLVKLALLSLLVSCEMRAWLKNHGFCPCMKRAMLNNGGGLVQVSFGGLSVMSVKVFSRSLQLKKRIWWMNCKNSWKWGWKIHPWNDWQAWMRWNFMTWKSGHEDFARAQQKAAKWLLDVNRCTFVTDSPLVLALIYYLIESKTKSMNGEISRRSNHIISKDGLIKDPKKPPCVHLNLRIPQKGWTFEVMITLLDFATAKEVLHKYYEITRCSSPLDLMAPVFLSLSVNIDRYKPLNPLWC